MKKLLVLLPLVCNAMDIEPMNIEQESVFARKDAGEIALSYRDSSFFVNNKEVQRADLDDTLRKVRSEDALKSLLGHNYIQAKRLSDDSYKLSAEGRLEGSGPIFATIAWAGIKSAGVAFAAVAHAVAKAKDKREGGHHHRDKHPSVVGHRSHHVAENLERAGQAVHAMHGGIADVAIEAGTSFIVDESGVMHIVDPTGTGSHAYLATMMAVDQNSVRQTQGVLDRIADAAYESILAMPNLP